MQSDTRMHRSFALILLLSLIAPRAFAQDDAPAPWVVATYAYPDRDRAAAIQPLADYLSKRSGHPAVVRILPSPSALVEAMRHGEVDVAVPNLHGFLQARAWPERIIPLPVPDVPAAQADHYRAVIVARSDVASLEALQRDAHRLDLALVGRDSASGGFVPAGQLRALGVTFASVAYAGSHHAALQAVLSGDADVAALAADVYRRSEHTELVELWQSEPIPPGPLLCLAPRDVSCDVIATWLLDVHAHDTTVMAALRAGWPEFGDADRFRETDLPALDALVQDIADDSAG